MIRTTHRTILVWRCPDCHYEVEQQLMGTQHSSLACIDCETDMESIGLEESEYDYEDALIENDGEYEVEYDIPDGQDALKQWLKEHDYE